MKNKLTALFLFFFLAINSLLTAQGWFRTFDITPYHEFTSDVVQTQDGGYVAIGTSMETPWSTSGIKDVVVIKTDADGELQWTQVLDYVPQSVSRKDLAQQVTTMPDGTIIVATTTYYYNQGGGSLRIWRLDPSGNILSGGNPAGMVIHDLIHTASGGLAATGTRYISTGPVSPYDPQNNLVVLDSLGNPIGGTTFGWGSPDRDDNGFAAVELSSGYYSVLTGSFEWTGTDWEGNYSLDLISPDGFVEDTNPIAFIDNIPVYGYLVPAENDLVVAAFRGPDGFTLRKLNPYTGWHIWTKEIDLPFGSQDPVFNSTQDGGFIVAVLGWQSVAIIKLDSEGVQEWQREIPVLVLTNSDPPSNMIDRSLGTVRETSDHSFIITGHYSPVISGHHQLFLLKTDSLGNFGGNLRGYVKTDVNGDCLTGAGEPPIEGWVVEATGPNGTYFGTTDQTGFYSILADTGNYTVNLLHPVPDYWNICNNGVQATIQNITDTVNLDMAVQPLVQCPLMDVDISTNFLRRCQDGYFTVKYCNYGTTTAVGAFTEVELDPYLNLEETNHPYTLTNNLLHFDLGDIPAGECGEIKIKVSVDCNAPAGITHCTTASVFPNDYCLPGNPPTGIEFSDTDCRPAIAPYDPNDKTASPEGTGPQHYIPADTTLSYLVRFQNTGNDTAFTVVIRDTLSPLLDIATFRPGAATHPYEWEIYGKRVLKFTFPDIMLPDSNVNEAASHGFIAFEINTMPGLLPETLIENSVGIYFDYNAPVITNTAFHTIEKPVHYGNMNLSLCTGTLFNSFFVTMDTTVLDTLSFPLYDSITTTHITAMPAFSSSFSATLCEGESILFGTQLYTQPDTYTQVFSAQNGCDSTVTLELSVLPAMQSDMSVSICEGESYLLGSQTYSQTGTYSQVFTAQNGCDSTVTLELSVLPTMQSDMSVSICEGESFLFGSQILSQSGTYTQAFASQNGCDSTVTLELSVLPTMQSDMSVSICEGESFLFGSQILSQSGTYTQAFASQNGCDSTVTLTLAAFPADSSMIEIDLCEGEESPLTGDIYEIEGEFTEQVILQNQMGCDSIVTGQIAVHPNVYAEGWVNYPYGYEEPGIVYTQDTTLIFIDTTEFGCEDIFVMRVHVYPNAVQDLEKRFNLHAFPNPANERLQLQFDLPEAYYLDIEILDMLGRQIAPLANHQFFTAGTHQLSFQSKDWPPGALLLYFQCEEGQAILKLMKTD